MIVPFTGISAFAAIGIFATFTRIAALAVIVAIRTKDSISAEAALPAK